MQREMSCQRSTWNRGALAASALIICVLACLITWRSLQAQPATPPAANQTEGAIRKVLQSQLDAWNRGDVDGFMEYYWKSDNLTFSSGGKTTRGWKAALERHKKRYPSGATLGP